MIAAFPSPATVLVPTHGDWQPRNWLHHQGLVHVIDFGRADWRPAESDLARLAVQHFTGRPDLEEPTSRATAQIRVTQPPGAGRSCARPWETACWGHQVGDAEFEAQGHRMIADVLRSL